MKYTLLGKSDLNVSSIGFGCMSLPQQEQDAISLIHAAIDKGINFFDTADVYNNGQNEIVVGKALQTNRSRVILASKVGNVRKTDGSPGFHWDPSKKHILDSIDKSLQRLNTDYLDLYQLHGGTIQDNIDETIDAFERLKEQGKIRYYGISSIRPNVIREYVKRSSIVSVMMQYSLLDRRPEEECLDLLHTHNISVLSRGTLAQGLLAGKPAKAYMGHTETEVAAAAEALHHNAAEAVEYVLANPAVASAVVGIRTVSQLDTLFIPVSADIDAARRSVKAEKYKEHRD